MSTRPEPKRPNCAVKLLQGNPVHLAAPPAARKVLEASVVDGIRADPMYATAYSNSLTAGGVRMRGLVKTVVPGAIARWAAKNVAGVQAGAGLGATGGGMGSQSMGRGVVVGFGVVSGAGNGTGPGVGDGVGGGYESGSGEGPRPGPEAPTPNPSPILPQRKPSTTPTRVVAFLLLELTKSTAIFLKAPTVKNALVKKTPKTPLQFLPVILLLFHHSS